MIELLPKWNLHGNKHSFYEADSVTLLELASRLTGTMNALIDDYNTFRDSVNNQVTEFINSTNADQEAFETALRQEFQDFIDIVDLKVKTLEELEKEISVLTPQMKSFAEQASADLETINGIIKDAEYIIKNIDKLIDGRITARMGEIVSAVITALPKYDGEVEDV